MKDTIKVHLSGVHMVAHRGVSGLERENTCAAFIAAGNRSYWGVETDVHRTADGRFLIIHDDDTRRVAGVDHSVEGTDFDTLRAIRMTDLEGHPRADLCFPELSEYANLCKKYDKDCVLELKNHFEPEDIERIISIVQGCGWLERTVFISFDLPNCLCLRRLLPRQRVQYLVSRFGDDLLDILTENHLDLDINYRALTAEHVAACHERGIAVNVWTVDDPEDARRLAGYGVDFITSNILE